MEKDIEKVSKINAELVRLLGKFRLTLRYDAILRIRGLLREAFGCGFIVCVRLRFGGRLAGEELRAFSYEDLERLNIDVGDVERIYCQVVCSK